MPVGDKRLSHNVAANVAQMLIGAALLFALYRYINDTLGAAALGVWSVVLATASASRLADLGLSASVTRFVARHLARNEPHIAARVIETAALSLMALLGLALPLLYLPLYQILSYLFDASHLAEARAILPYALGSLWLTIAAAVFQSGLDGCQRMDLRAGLVVLGQLLMVTLAFHLVPGQGLVGLALAQIAQAFFLLIAGWCLLKGRLRVLPCMPLHWSRSLFRAMLGYGANVQAATLFMLLFDPLTKALMAKFGGASAAGYFEMANQVVLKVRALIVAANQAIVPRVTQIAETSPERLPVLYRQNLRALIFVALPIFALLYAWSGVFSWLLVGHIQADLLFLLRLSTVAWLLNLFTVPAYFANMGTGRVGWNTLSHVVTGLLNGGFGWILGQWFGVEGVAWAYGVALVAGSWLLAIAFQIGSDVRFRELALAEHGWITVVSVGVAAAGHYAWRTSGSDVVWALAIIAVPLVLVVAAWRHPLRAELWVRFAPRLLGEHR